MGVYADRIGPRLIKCLCSSPDIAAERAAIVPQASGVVLEIGFGPGLNLSHYDPGKIERVIGVDPNEGFLRLGSGARPPVPVEVFRAPAEAIPLPDDVADTAIVTYTLCSVEDPARALGEVLRVLKPGGRVLFVEHGRASEAGVARWQDRLTPPLAEARGRLQPQPSRGGPSPRGRVRHRGSGPALPPGDPAPDRLPVMRLRAVPPRRGVSRSHARSGM